MLVQVGQSLAVTVNGFRPGLDGFIDLPGITRIHLDRERRPQEAQPPDRHEAARRETQGGCSLKLALFLSLDPRLSHRLHIAIHELMDMRPEPLGIAGLGALASPNPNPNPKPRPYLVLWLPSLTSDP